MNAAELLPQNMYPFTISYESCCHSYCTVFQIRRGNWDNLVIISLISPQKHIL